MCYDQTSEPNQTFIFFLIVKMRVTDHKVLSEIEYYIIIIPVCNVSRLICVFNILVFALFCLRCIARPVLHGTLQCYDNCLVYHFMFHKNSEIKNSKNQDLKLQFPTSIKNG